MESQVRLADDDRTLSSLLA